MMQVPSLTPSHITKCYAQIQSKVVPLSGLRLSSAGTQSATRLDLLDVWHKALFNHSARVLHLCHSGKQNT